MEPCESVQSKELPLKGVLTIQRAAELKEELLAALNQVDNLMLILSEAREVDLSCLQLLCSCNRSAVRLNKSLSLIGELPDAFSSLLKDTGLLGHVGCPEECDRVCLWSEEPEINKSWKG
jgi:ABC-type transporter Mla MlaB component